MKIDQIKAWKDEEYRSTLSKEQLGQIENPAGTFVLSDEDMSNVNGGTTAGLVCVEFPPFTSDTTANNNSSYPCCLIK